VLIGGKGSVRQTGAFASSEDIKRLARIEGHLPPWCRTRAGFVAPWTTAPAAFRTDVGP
jgi:hypothetical protein